MESRNRTLVPGPSEILDAFCKLADDDCGPKWRHNICNKPYRRAELWQEFPKKEQPRTPDPDGAPEITGCIFLTAADEIGLVENLVKWTSKKKLLDGKWPTGKLGVCCSQEELAIKLLALGYM